LRRETLKLLWDMQQAGKAVDEFLRGKTLEEYLQSLLLRSAVERQLFVVGEALAQMSRWEPDVADSFQDKRAIIGFRNMLAHGYADVVDERVYTIATIDLPQLMVNVETLLSH